jgi:hypothetical protein
MTTGPSGEQESGYRLEEREQRNDAELDLLDAIEEELDEVERSLAQLDDER